MKRAKEGMDQCVQVLIPDRRELDKAHPLEGISWLFYVVGTAIYGHGMTLFDKTGAKLLDTCLEPAVTRGNTACPQHRHVQLPGIVSRS